MLLAVIRNTHKAFGGLGVGSFGLHRDLIPMCRHILYPLFTNILTVR